MNAFWLQHLPNFIRIRLDGRLTLQSIIGNAGWLIFDKFFRVIVALVVGAWLARYLGPSQFGQISYVLAIMALFQAVVVLGLDGILVRDIARDQSIGGEILATAIALRAAAGVISWFVAVAATAVLNGLDDKAVIFMMLSGGVLVLQAADTIDLWFQSQSQSRYSVIARSIGFAISNGIRVVLILSEAPLYAFVVLLSVEATLTALSYYILFFIRPFSVKFIPNKQIAKRLLSDGWPFLLSSLSVVIFMRIDQVMIKHILGDQQLGLYAAALPIVQTGYFIPNVIILSFAPFIARLKNGNEERYFKTMALLMRWMTLISILLAGIIYLCSGLLVTVLYGSGYQETVGVVKILALVNLFVFLGVTQGLLVLNESAKMVTLGATMFSAIMGVLGNYWLIPLWGINGAGAAHVIAQFCSVVLIPLLFLPAMRRVYTEALGFEKYLHCYKL